MFGPEIAQLAARHDPASFMSATVIKAPIICCEHNVSNRREYRVARRY